MKRILSYKPLAIFLYIWAVLPFILSGCASVQSYYEHGEYDKAIQKAVVKLRKNNQDFETARLLQFSYQNANRIDLDRINLLKSGQSDEIWEEVYQRYIALNARQNLVLSVPGIAPNRSFNGRLFHFRDYLEDIADSRDLTVKFLYAKGQKLLQTGYPSNARKAYEHLERANRYRPGYKDVIRLLAEAREAGTIKVALNILLVSDSNTDGIVRQQISRMDTLSISNPWLRIDNPPIYSQGYDFVIEVVYEKLFVGPEKIKETIKTEEGSVQNGWLYKYDKNGNVKKDADGNDIKIPRFEKVYCELREYVQEKKASAKVTVTIYDKIYGSIIASKRFSAKARFLNNYAVAYGDVDILNKKDYSSLKKSRKRHFPRDEELVTEAVVKIQQKIEFFLRDHKNDFYR